MQISLMKIFKYDSDNYDPYFMFHFGSNLNDQQRLNRLTINYHCSYRHEAIKVNFSIIVIKAALVIGMIEPVCVKFDD